MLDHMGVALTVNRAPESNALPQESCPQPERELRSRRAKGTRGPEAHHRNRPQLHIVLSSHPPIRFSLRFRRKVEERRRG